MNESPEQFLAANIIKDIGRGKKGARDMSSHAACDLYRHMLNRNVSDLELGAILMAMRIKGESVAELGGFMAAAEESFERIPSWTSPYAPVSIPSYNGARKMANLTPLLALLLAREGVPVLMHGVLTDPGRVTSAEIFAAMGMLPAASAQDVHVAFAQGKPAFMAIETLAPKLAWLLSLRRILGVRSSTHTLVKILQPFEGPALRLVSYTHPEYLETLGEYFLTAAPQERGDAFLMHGTEGETVANANRAQQIDWFHSGQRTLLVRRDAPTDELAQLPQARDAATTANWISRALAGQEPIPEAIAEQVAQCLLVSKSLQANTGGHHGAQG